ATTATHPRSLHDALPIFGSGGRGQYILRLAMRDPGIRVGGVWDVYEPNLEKSLSLAGNKARAYRDHQTLLDDKSIDIVIIATPQEPESTRPDSRHSPISY